MKTDKIIAEQIASEYAPKQDRKIVAFIKLNKKAKQPISRGGNGLSINNVLLPL